MKKVTYNSVWEYIFSASISKSEKILNDLPVQLKLGMSDDNTHYLCGITSFRNTLKDYNSYLDACKKYGFKQVDSESFTRLSELLGRAFVSKDGKNYIVNMVNKRYFESDIGIMNEALK